MKGSSENKPVDVLDSSKFVMREMKWRKRNWCSNEKGKKD